MGQAVRCSLSNMSCGSAEPSRRPTAVFASSEPAVQRPRGHERLAVHVQLARVPRKCPPDAEVIDELTDDLTEAHLRHVDNSGELASASDAQTDQAVSIADFSTGASSRLPPLPSAGALPSTAAPAGRGGRGRTPSQSVVASSSSASSPAVSKAEASGRSSRAPCADESSTACSDAGGDARCDDDTVMSSASESSYSASSASVTGGFVVAGGPRPPECVAKLLFGRQATNRIMATDAQHRGGNRESQSGGVSREAGHASSEDSAEAVPPPAWV